MARKSFKENNPVMQVLQEQQEKLSEQDLKSDPKTKEVKEKKGKVAKKAKVKETKTRGAKQVRDEKNEIEKKFPRINKVLTKENLRYICEITDSKDESFASYFNRLVNEDQTRQPAGKK